MRRRIRPLALPILLVTGVASISFVLFGAAAHAQSAQPPAPSTTLVPGASPHALGETGGTKYSDTQEAQVTATGHQLFAQACASCHGVDAQGTARAPTLVGLGPAAVDFWVITGRMPLEVPSEQAIRKNPVFSKTQAKAIAEYVASLKVPGYQGDVGQGPAIPTNIDLGRADLAQGGEMFRLNCSTCHSLTASGGALSYGAYAPSLSPDSPLEIAEAIRTGPGNMPRFTVAQLSNKDMDGIIKYVKYVTKPQDRGGFNLGHIGPTTEGFIGIVVGVGVLMLAAFWIGDRA
jgi:ubiquinol-cytochrome c reductase cytochrome c subunit